MHEELLEKIGEEAPELAPNMRYQSNRFVRLFRKARTTLTKREGLESKLSIADRIPNGRIYTNNTQESVEYSNSPEPHRLLKDKRTKRYRRKSRIGNRFHDIYQRTLSPSYSPGGFLNSNGQFGSPYRKSFDKSLGSRRRPPRHGYEADADENHNAFKNSFNAPSKFYRDGYNGTLGGTLGASGRITESIVPEKRRDLQSFIAEVMVRLDRVMAEVERERNRVKRKNIMNKTNLAMNIMKHKKNSRIYGKGLKLHKKNSSEMTRHNAKQQVFFNDKKWNIVTSMVTGIYKSINLISDDRKLVPSKLDFSICNKIELEAVLERKFNKCKFKDYAPNVFEAIRNTFGISNQAYMESIGYHTFQKAFLNKLSLMLTENSSGKSGSFFFHTADMKFMIKTIKTSEFCVLKKQLIAYYNYIVDNPETLLTKYYGLHQLKCYSATGKVVYAINIGGSLGFKLLKANKFLALSKFRYKKEIGKWDSEGLISRPIYYTHWDFLD